MLWKNLNKSIAPKYPEEPNDLVNERPCLLSLTNYDEGSGLAPTDGLDRSFFITFKEAYHLNMGNKRHYVFGEVIEGKDVIDKME